MPLNKRLLGQGPMSERSKGAVRAPTVVTALLGILVPLVICMLWAVTTFGSAHDAWLYAKGSRLAIEPSTIGLVQGRVGDARDLVVRVRNLSGSPTTIIGVTSSCSCMSTEKLPITLDARQARDLHLSVRLVRDGRFEQQMIYHTDNPAVPKLAVIVATSTL
jgi:hypothetical protein